MEEKNICYEHRARYYEYGNMNHAKELWFVLHGQGQLAQYFIRKFNTLNPDDYFIVAPEGLSRYYLNGHSGRVGATWMTKEDRLTDIENYVAYLNTIYKQVLENINRDIKITAFGFSQGTATVSRWIAQSNIKIDRLLLWAGIFPPDMDIKSAHERFNTMKVYNIYGDNDEFLNNNYLKEQQNIIKEIGITATTIQFEGTHVIDQSTLCKIATTPY